MSFAIYKTVPTKLSYNSTYSHYDLIGSSAHTIKYIYTDKSPTVNFHYGEADDSTPSTDKDINLISGTTTTNSDEGYKTYENFYTLYSNKSIHTIAYVTQANSLATTDDDINFYLIDSSADSKLELTPANSNAPTSLSILETFPNNKGYNLMNGSFITYTPNRKRRIIVGFEYLPETTLENFITFSKKPVIIVPEGDENDVSPFEGKSYACSWEGNELNFQYSAKYKKAGYNGNIAFREI